MGLGLYEDVTTLAGKMGGMDKFLGSLEKAAYEKGMTAGIKKGMAAGFKEGAVTGFNKGVAVGFNKGTVVGVVITGAAGGVAVAAHWYMARKERAEETQKGPAPGAPEFEDSDS